MLFLSMEGAVAQSGRFTISGNITDSATGEDLIGASVYVKELKTGTSANAYGFYSLTIPEGTHLLEVSFVGYELLSRQIDLRKNEKLNIKLTPAANELQEVVISSESKNANVTRSEMSMERISMKTLKRIPALMGEVDV
ncbi:MAG: carboxypeptidase-like regulatory domain-containing protein, partial [Bacteroidales bacterium]|nr:carboxypeptidase-like regulatory domain-containing protein [Bacteroidales bacterium]